MAKYLVIVESPAKSKTIEKYLGSEYTVTSSLGHIRDLTTRGYGGYGVDIDNNFMPMYKVMKDKHELVRALKKEAKSVDKVYLATDPDREGEAISWHLLQVLELKDKPYERIVFNEITKGAILNALKEGRDIDINLVKSQESRRIVDRIIGFSLSKLLQKKIGSKSAGRVQSVALKLICDREKEIQAFKPVEYFDIYFDASKGARVIKSKLERFNGEKINVKNGEEAKKIVASLNDNAVVASFSTKERIKKPSLPYTTSTLQQDASIRLNFTAKKTMLIAQKLYEGVDMGTDRVGLITYMRTDSIRLANEFIYAAKKHIEDTYGANYFHGYYASNAGDANVQDAHEAIRPSIVTNTPEIVKPYLSNDEFKLYSLIYNRAVSAMMANAIVEDQKVTFNNNGYEFDATGEKVLFDGFLKIYPDIDDAKSLPKINEGETLKGSIRSEQKFTNPPARYTEARLIKKMEELGIGRPSTYAVTMETLKIRNYAKLEKKAFVATPQGILTSDTLDQYFNKVINIEYTSNMESMLDEIAIGKADEVAELKKFYYDYKPLLDYADENMDRKYPIELDEACPECGRPLLIRNGRFGEFIACSGFPKCRYIRSKEEKEVPVSTGIKCPNCEAGYIVERVSKRGRSKGQKFYACDQYPKCKTTYTSLDEIKQK